jgi:hypothetical protein
LGFERINYEKGIFLFLFTYGFVYISNFLHGHKLDSFFLILPSPSFFYVNNKFVRNQFSKKKEKELAFPIETCQLTLPSMDPSGWDIKSALIIAFNLNPASLFSEDPCEAVFSFDGPKQVPVPPVFWLCSFVCNQC